MNKKVFYKQWWFIILIIFIIGTIGVYIKDEVKSTPRKFDWDDIKACDKLPEPKSNTGVININKKNNLNMAVYKVSRYAFDEYVKECKEMGYEERVMKNSDIHFNGEDKNGNFLSVTYDEKNKSMIIQLLFVAGQKGVE